MKNPIKHKRHSIALKDPIQDVEQGFQQAKTVDPICFYNYTTKSFLLFNIYTEKFMGTVLKIIYRNRKYFQANIYFWTNIKGKA